MKIVIIGSGNVAYHLAKAFVDNGVPVAQLFGRNTKDLQDIGEKLHIPYAAENLLSADLYLIAVSDDAIAEVSKIIKDPAAIVAHTSGSVSINALSGNFRKAVIYPLQTFSKEKIINWGKIPFFIDAENESDLAKITQLLQCVSENIIQASDQKRQYIHLTAVFACNFVNHLYARAQEIADAENIPFHYFLPLIEETAQKIKTISPKDAQTGPAIRNDQKVLTLHENLIKNTTQLRIYKIMNESIKEMYGL